MMKKVLSIILALVMVIGVMPFSAFAGETTLNEWETGLDDSAVYLHKVKTSDGTKIGLHDGKGWGKGTLVEFGDETLLDIGLDPTIAKQSYIVSTRNVYTDAISSADRGFDYSTVKYIAIRMKIVDNNTTKQSPSLFGVDAWQHALYSKGNISQFFYDLETGRTETFTYASELGYAGLLVQGSVDGYYIFDLTAGGTDILTYILNSITRLQLQFYNQAAVADKTPASSWENKTFYLGDAFLVQDKDKFVAARNKITSSFAVVRKYDKMIKECDDANAYAYIAENRSDCQDALKRMIIERIGKTVEITVKQNDTGQASDDLYPDLRQMIHFEIEEDNF